MLDDCDTFKPDPNYEMSLHQIKVKNHRYAVGVFIRFKPTEGQLVNTILMETDEESKNKLKDALKKLQRRDRNE